MLTDRQRVEIALPPSFFFRIAASSCFNDPTAEEVLELRRLLHEASMAPIADLQPKAAAKLSKRIDRAHDAIVAELYDRPAVEVAMALFYFLEDLLSREILILHEDTAFARAFAIMAPMFEHGFEDLDLDLSARRAAERVLSDLQALGYFPGA